MNRLGGDADANRTVMQSCCQYITLYVPGLLAARRGSNTAVGVAPPRQVLEDLIQRQARKGRRGRRAGHASVYGTGITRLDDCDLLLEGAIPAVGLVAVMRVYV